jgi:PKD repeat protein
MISVKAQTISVCGTDTVTLDLSNYQFGPVQWEESYDGVNWKAIDGANDLTYTFYPKEAKYYHARIIYPDCDPGFSEATLVQVAPKADAGPDRVISDNAVNLLGNEELGSQGTWAIIAGAGGILGNPSIGNTELTGTDSLYILEWTLTNSCGTSKDTMYVEFVQNKYINTIVVVDTTDQILSDSTQHSQGLYIIKFNTPVPVVNDSTVLIGLMAKSFLRTVDSVIVEGDTFTMYTQQGTLDDITEEGVHDLAQTFDLDSTLNKRSYSGYTKLNHLPTRHELQTDTKFQSGRYYYVIKDNSVYTYPGVSYRRGMKKAGSALIDLTFNSTLYSDANATLTLQGSYTFTPNLIGELKHTLFNVQSFKFGMYNAKVVRNIQLNANISGAINLADKDFTLLSITKHIVFFVGAVPVIIEAKLNVDGEIGADASGAMNLGYEFTKTSTYTAAIEYANGSWVYPYNRSESVQANPVFNVSGDYTQHFNIGPNLSFRLYNDVVGPYVDLRLENDFDLCFFNSDWQANLQLGGLMGVGARGEVLGNTLFDVNVSWPQSFYHLRLPDAMQMESGNNQSYTFGSQLAHPVKIIVKSNKGFKTPLASVYFNPKNGGSVQNSSVITNQQGEAETYWTPGGINQSELEAYVLDCNGDDIRHSPITFKAYSNGINCAQSSLSASVQKTGSQIRPDGHLGAPPYEYSTDGTNYVSQVPSINATPGQSYKFWVKDTIGCIVTTTHTEPDSCVTSSLSLMVTITANSAIANGQGGNPPYQYSLNNPNTGYTPNNNFTNLPAGNHTFYVRDAYGCIAFANMVVTDTLPPISAAFAANPRSDTVGATISFSNFSNNATSWSWDFGDSGSSTVSHSTHVYTSPGLYSVSLTVYNANDTATETKTDYIFIGPSANLPDAEFSANATAINLGDTVLFTNLSINAPTSYIWDFGDGSSTNQTSPFKQYNNVGTYNVTLIATNSFGSDTLVKPNYITVLPVGNPPLPPHSPSPANGTSAVLNNSLLTWSCADPDGDTLAYNVYFGTSSNPPLILSGLSSTTFTPALNINTTYYWKVKADDGNGNVVVGPTWSFTTSNINLGPNDVYNPTTGEIWMDRNLGALQVATSSTDTAAYGDLYQWGRAADGHQLRTSSTISTTSSSNTPGHGGFITGSSNWLSPANNNLWQGVNGINNPCPNGYRLPTHSEWQAELNSWISNDAAGAFASPLKLPMAGLRSQTNGVLLNVGSGGEYWSSTVSPAPVNFTNSRDLSFSSVNAFNSSLLRGVGACVRCIKD